MLPERTGNCGNPGVSDIPDAGVIGRYPKELTGFVYVSGAA
ncbi:hypothetical protein [Natronogracilivirga saccharolytica]|nr:hypothetical protein [Natronogracilivirga saccharolytica]